MSKNKVTLTKKELEADAERHFISLVSGSEELANDVAGENYTQNIIKKHVYVGRHLASQEKKPRF